MSNAELALYFFLQAAIILGVVRVVGRVAMKLGQPVVIGEMIAGILLGPSVLGAIFPDLHAQLFPKPTVSVIYVISQVGLVLFMFLVGVEFQFSLINRRLRSAASVSLTGIIAPFILGGLLALLLKKDGNLYPPGISTWGAMVFTGAAMAITAFPVLARIIHERGISGTPLGTLTLAAASIDDAMAWGLLALVLASLNGNGLAGLAAIGGGAVYAVFMLTLGRRYLHKLDKAAVKNQGVTSGMINRISLVLMLGAFYTDWIGIHAVFGAFILGMTMPRGFVTQELEKKIRPLVQGFLLPLFFVYSGLNTQLGLVALKPALWGIALVVLLVACLGKGVGCWIAARLSGESNREAVGIGVLMNARGLTELIILNIGLERGIINPPMFAVMVIMAIVTTMMTTPLFKLLYEKGQQIKVDPETAQVLVD